MKIEKWEVYEQGDADEFCLLMEGKRWVIAFRLDGGLYREQQKRVVDMIAAAPDMYEALKGFVAKLDTAILVEGDHPTSHLADELRAALAALAKAEGRDDG